MNKKSIVIILVVIIVLLSVAGFFIIQKINNDKLDYSLEQITENKYFTLKINDKYGVIDREGKIIVETTYDRVEIPNPSKDIFICYKDEKGIAINSNKQQMFSEYNSIQAIQLKNSSNNIPYEKSTLISEKNGKYGLIDFTGKKILETEFDEIEGFSNIEGQLQVKKNGKLGVVNIKGTTIVKTEYDNIIGDNYYNESNNYKEAGYIVGQKNENGYKYGYVNNKGELKLKLEYNDIYRITNIDYNQGIYLITSKNGQYGVMTNYANIINNEYQSIEYDNSNNVFIIQRNKKYGVADISGKIIIPVENTNIQSKGEYIYVERNNIKQVYDAKGNKIDLDFNKTIMPTSNENYKIVITSNENGNYYGVIGANDKQVIKSEYIYIEYAYNNYFIVCGQNGKLGVIDSNENTVIELNYDLVQKIQGKNMIQTLSSDTNITELYYDDLKKISEMQNATIDNQKDYVRIYSNNESKYYNSEGKEISNTELFPNNNIYTSSKDNKWGYIDKNGNTKVDYEYELANELNEYGYAAVKKDGKWGCINANGKIIVEPKYEFNENYNKVDFIGEYIKVDNIYTNEI